MNPLDVRMFGLGATSERERIVKLLEVGFQVDEVAQLLGVMAEDYEIVKNELLDIQDSLEEETRPKAGRFPHVEYQTGWYQDLDGNLYKYDGIVWDVVPETRTGRLEFLG